jgi:hypothetical protein
MCVRRTQDESGGILCSSNRDIIENKQRHSCWNQSRPEEIDKMDLLFLDFNVF